MTKTVDYYLTLISPYAYLGGRRFAEIVARHDAKVNVYPVNYGKVFPASGGLPLAKRAKQRQAYRLVELERWRDHLKMPLNLQPKYFPADEALAARMVIAARRDSQDALALSNAILSAVWAEEKNIAEPETLMAVAASVGLDGESLLGSAGNPEISGIYDADTDNAIELGVFGAPTYVIDGEMFWGQDRLDFVDRNLAE